MLYLLGDIACYLIFMLCFVIFMLRYITCYVAMLYNMLSYAMLYNVLCSVMFISRYRTCIVYVMLYNMLYLCYITCHIYVI